MDIKTLSEKQRTFFNSGKTLETAYRLRALEALERGVKDREQRLREALFSDLGKSGAEAYMCEIGLALSELRYMKKHLRSFARNRRGRLWRSFTPKASPCRSPTESCW